MAVVQPSDIRILAAGENAYLIYFSNEISPYILHLIKTFCDTLKSNTSYSFIHIIPAYNNVLLKLKHNTPSSHHDSIVAFLQQTAYQCIEKEEENIQEISANSKTHYLPVYYHPEVGMDCEKVIQDCQLDSLEHLINLHSNLTYTVYAVGFSPGFSYLAELDKKIHIPRLDSPRLSVPRGSVAIANKQTAVYPISTPGGWHIIGNCPTSLTPTEHNISTIWQIADRVIFEPIERKMYQKLGGKLTHEFA